MHWIEKVVEDLIKYLESEKGKRKEDVIIINGGLSVSGLQHIGRLRGEVILGEVVRRLLESKGYRVKQYLVLYTQDAWKGKEAQVKSFSSEMEGRKYAGWPLIRVPDPYGCHSNWVEHFWEDFGSYLNTFTDGKIQVVTTTHLYMTKLKGLVKEAIEKRESLRGLINKYRGRNPYPEGWIPFEPICERCGRIDSTRATAYREDTEEIEYICENCGHRGISSIHDGKLNWRIEWASVWKALDIDFEPFGKDHATPGGSRDSCVDLSINIFGNVPPLGMAYEWVSLRSNGREFDMGSSDFIGITPREWYNIAHPEVLRFLYVKESPRKRIVIDLSMIPSYYDEFFRAEALYYQALGLNNGLEGLSEDKYILARSYEMSLLNPPPPIMPVQVSFLTMSLAAQLVPRDNLTENVVRRLRSSRIITRELSTYDFERLEGMAWRAKNWVESYAPEYLRIHLLAEVKKEVLKTLKYRDALISLGRELQALTDTWSEPVIKEAMIKATGHLSDEDRKEFYREFYRVLIGRDYGPRAAALVEVLGPDFIKKRLIDDLTS